MTGDTLAADPTPVAGVGRLNLTATAHRVATVTTLVAAAAGLVLATAADEPGRIVNPFLPVMVGSSVLYGTLGHFVARRYPGHPVAVVLTAVGVVGGVTVLAGGHANAALFGPLPETGATASLWLSRWAWVVLLGLQSVGLLLAYPDGRLPSRRWWPAVGFAAAGPAALAAVSATTPFTESVWQPVPVENPLAVQPSPVVDAAYLVAGMWFVAGSAIAAAALFARYRQDAGARVGLVLIPAALMPPALLASEIGLGGLAEVVVALMLAIAVTWSMLRHRVLDLDVLVHRGLIYALLVLSLIGAYVAVVTVTAQALGDWAPWVPGVLAAAVVAVSFGPLLQQLRTGIDRLFYGDRTRPAAVIVRLAETSTAADAEEILTEAAEALRASLRVPWVHVQAGPHHAQAGDRRTHGRAVPLRHNDADIGVLEVGARYDGERLTTADERVLDAAARQLAGTAHTLLLAQRLSVARERLVAAREDERRRVRRDLHDGLGPALAGISAGLDGAEAIAQTDHAAAVALLPGLRRQAEEAVADVRRLVDGLRPPALDALGLVGALRQELGHLAVAGDTTVRLDAPARSEDLGAATEVAVLRIALEAVHNVRRHAMARTCTVTLDVDGPEVTLSVRDDGAGMPGDVRANVGLNSMRERAEEIGGTLVIESTPGAGTVVTARLPRTVAP
ncbi:Histidine kinase-, DNA gyrase B-, and HSP90-like ATPase [Micromonospora viridifaciens]|uniref:Oxygen sensor histidine kinase NreB n=1 Tax=Micromonospora viridifaciens TaxID=1881 RepID=A0A1C4YG36_MICVI|nr:sensor histidine kinase [Micromonospora viridifaciens]SCF19674.1 Histidine kinase-, DNA gyrase B-, and HSP90-like ATPase [Micromonospora viridifaciens]